MAGVGTATQNAYDWNTDAQRVTQFMSGGLPPGHAGDLAVGMGTDTDGLAPGMPPRAGSRVAYGAGFPMSESGKKKWDYNTDGVAHYGMLADYLKDIRTAPGGAALIDNNLMNGAQYFYEMWMKCQELASVKAPPPPRGK